VRLFGSRKKIKKIRFNLPDPPNPFSHCITMFYVEHSESRNPMFHVEHSEIHIPQSEIHIPKSLYDSTTNLYWIEHFAPALPAVCGVFG
jgi:hypothetical protein